MANEVKIDIDVETQKARKSIERLEKSFSEFADTATKETNQAIASVDVFGNSLAAVGFASFVSGAFDAAESILGIGLASLEAASDAEETESKFNTVFRSISDEAQTTADTLATSYGLAGSEARKLLGDTGDLLTGFGFAQDQALDLSKQVQELAVDLASFTNFSGGAAGASEALTKALLGERESVKALGISIQEADVQKQVAINSAKGVTFETEREAKAYATLQLAVSQSGNAIGDFARTQDQLANQQRILNANLQTTTENFGKGLIPAFTDITKVANGFLTQNQELVKSFGELAGQKVQEFFDGALNSITPLGSAVVFINDVFVGLLTTWDFVRVGLNELTGFFISSTESVLEAARATKEFLGLDTTELDQTIESVRLLKEANEEVTQDISASIDARLEAQSKFKESVTETAAAVEQSLKSQVSAEKELTNVVVEENQKRQESRKAASDPTEQQVINQKVIDLEKAKSEKLIELKAQEIATLNELKAEDAALEEETRLIKVELESEQADERLEQLVEILGTEEAIRSEAEARRLDKEGKVAQARKKRQSADAKAEKENIFAVQKFEELSQKQRVANLQSTFGTIASLSDSNNKALAAAGKAAAISQATIDGFAAVQKALASAPPPFNFALAGLVGAASAANVAKIAGVKGFQDGGVVDGTPQDRDNQTVNVASGEVILNRRQQAETLFQIANGGGGASGGGGLNINIEAGIGGVSDEQVDSLINQINDRTEFGNQSLRTA